MKNAIACFLAAACAIEASAEVKVQVVDYKDGDTKLRGYLAYDDAVKEKRPGVMVIHEWWGCNDYSMSRAKQLAELGYVAFACDMYGAGVTTKDPAEAGKLAGQIRADKAKWRQRAAAGLKVLSDHASVDASRLGAIGYCFGGTTALQMACAGMDLKVVVSFHGSLFTPTLDEAKAVKGKVLVCNGAADGFIQPADREGFVKAFEAAKVDYVFVDYAGAVHTFTNPDAGKAGIPGVAYDEKADKRSWTHMKQMFEEAFGAVMKARAMQDVPPGDAPAPLTDAQIAKMDKTTAMKEWVNRKTFPLKNPGLDQSTKSRLDAESKKLKDQMDSSTR